MLCVTRQNRKGLKVFSAMRQRWKAPIAGDNSSQIVRADISKRRAPDSRDVERSRICREVFFF